MRSTNNTQAVKSQYIFDMKQPISSNGVKDGGSKDSSLVLVSSEKKINDVTLQSELDFSERNENTQEDHWLNRILTFMPIGVIRLNGQGNIVQCNPTAETLLEFNETKTLLGQSWINVVKQCFSPRIDDGHEVSTRSGRRFSISTCSLGEKPGQLIVLNDLTETRELQEGLNRYKRLSEMGNMVAMLAHQVRTPLSAALLYTEMIQRNEIDNDLKDLYSNKVIDRLRNIEQQIRDMLIFAKGDYPINEMISCHEIEIQIKKSSESILLATESICKINNQCSQLRMLCHQESLIGAIQNLINNAIQAVDKKADIVINLSKLCDAYIKIEVKDNGPGFPKEKIHQMIKPFETSKTKGTGLGLAIVNNVVRAHNGSFSIETDTGKGVKATLLLPILKEFVSIDRTKKNKTVEKV